MGELEWGETLEEFYKLHNLDENRKSPGYKVRTKWIRPHISKYIREDEDEDSSSKLVRWRYGTYKRGL